MSFAEKIVAFDFSTIEDITQLLQHAIRKRAGKTNLKALNDVETRFNIKTQTPTISRELDLTYVASLIESFEQADRVKAVISLISNANIENALINTQLIEDTLKYCGPYKVIRFSFPAAIVACLTYANTVSRPTRRDRAPAPVVYAGIEADLSLVAVTALFLELPIHVETGTPWETEVIDTDDDVDDEPTITAPGLEVTCPPAVFTSDDWSGYQKKDDEIEPSIRKTKIPRAVDNKKFDLESVMLAYLATRPSSSLAFVSHDFLTTPKRSRAHTRKILRKSGRMRSVAAIHDLKKITRFAVELGAADQHYDNVIMKSANRLPQQFEFEARELRGANQTISPAEIENLQGVLLPSKYLGNGPTAGNELQKIFENLHRPVRTRLADLFDVIRPKTTRHDSNGDFPITEVRAGDITELGEIAETSRQLLVMTTKADKLEEQELSPGDILLAHRGPVGRVAYYVPKLGDDGSDLKVWAGQSVMILRARTKSADQIGRPACDPRMLFMYLQSPVIQKYWRETATDIRSPSLSIGSIERLEIAEPLLVFKNKSKENVAHNKKFAARQKLFLKAFQTRQDTLVRINRLQSQLERDLNKVSAGILNF